MVYLVDDDIDDLEIIQDAFAQNEFIDAVITLPNGKILMDKLLEDPEAKPDAILLDLHMPIKDGFEVLHEIKSHPLLRSIPVIVLTISENKEDELRCFQLGCNFYFTKPNSMQEYKSVMTVVKKITGKPTS